MKQKKEKRVKQTNGVKRLLTVPLQMRAAQHHESYALYCVSHDWFCTALRELYPEILSDAGDAQWIAYMNDISLEHDSFEDVKYIVLETEIPWIFRARILLHAFMGLFPSFNKRFDFHKSGWLVGARYAGHMPRLFELGSDSLAQGAFLELDQQSKSFVIMVMENISSLYHDIGDVKLLMELGSVLDYFMTENQKYSDRKGNKISLHLKTLLERAYPARLVTHDGIYATFRGIFESSWMTKRGIISNAARLREGIHAYYQRSDQNAYQSLMYSYFAGYCRTSNAPAFVAYLHFDVYFSIVDAKLCREIFILFLASKVNAQLMYEDFSDIQYEALRHKIVRCFVLYNCSVEGDDAFLRQLFSEYAQESWFAPWWQRQVDNRW